MTLEVIGPGFGRTGTNSLRRALEVLGFGPCHHMYELTENRELLPNWEALTRGELVDWDEVFEGFRAQVDWPGATFWRELCAHFPGAKVVLSVREPESWFASMEKTIIPVLEDTGPFEDEGRDRHMAMVKELVGNRSLKGRWTERDIVIEQFNNRIAEVQAEIAPERLLTFDVREGWGPLCAFLGVDVPDVDFPNTNNAKDFNDPDRTV